MEEKQSGKGAAIVYNADAFQIVDTFIKDKATVHHIITDPPYNISQTNNFHTLANARHGIDFGEWDRNFDLFSWIPKYAQILDRNGSMIVFCSYRYISHIIDVMEEHSGLIVKDILVWQKSNPMPRNINRRYVQDMEFAIWAVKKGAKWVFNKPEDESYARGLFTAPVVSGKERTSHPTQKSLALMKRIVSIHTNPGEFILDPFMGSGTTGVAAKELNRYFRGIELDSDYYEIALSRIYPEGLNIFD